MNIFNNFSFYDTLESIIIELSVCFVVLLGGICLFDVFVIRRGNTHNQPSNMCSPRPATSSLITLGSTPMFGMNSPGLILSSLDTATTSIGSLSLPETFPEPTANLSESAPIPPEEAANSSDSASSPLEFATTSPSPYMNTNEHYNYSQLFDASYLDFTMGSSEFYADRIESGYESNSLDYARIFGDLMSYDEESKNFGYTNVMGFSSCWSPTCNICMEEMTIDKNIAGLLCMHCFHTDCLKRWMAEKPDCPVCRQPTHGIISRACST